MRLLKSQPIIAFSIITLLTIACSSLFRSTRSLPTAPDFPSDTREENRQQQDENHQRRDALANGESIYFTGFNLDGQQISYRGGPNFGGMMMGSYLTCAACHGPEARGGVHVMHMQIMDAPDIRYAALSEEEGEHESDQGEEHADEHGEYDLGDFRMAVMEGKHPNGELLSRDMPRWKMKDRDLQDLFEFLRSIP
jgi:hypothetical protein